MSFRTFLALSVMVAAAVAQPVIAEPSPDARDWSGPYVGLFTVLPGGDNTWHGVDDFSSAALIPDDWAGHPTGLALGMDWQNGATVLGAVLEMSAGGLSASPQNSTSFICIPGCLTHVSNLVALRGRVGLAREDLLIFASAGVASGRVWGSSGPDFDYASKRRQGWTAGFGAEYAIDPAASVTVEYLQTDLGTHAAIPGFATSKINFGSVRLGLNYRW